MVLTLEAPTMPTPPADPTPQRPWYCQCGHYLGRWINGTLHLPRGEKASAPLVRRCPNCGKFHRRLTAPE